LSGLESKLRLPSERGIIEFACKSPDSLDASSFVRLGCAVEIVFRPEQIILFNERGAVQSQRSWRAELFVRLIREGCYVSQLEECGTPASVKELLKQLLDLNLLEIGGGVLPPTYGRLVKNLGFFSLFSATPVLSQTRLSNSRVVILGMGALGSIILQLLALAGVQRFIIVDADKVELSNLNRQPLFGYSDLGEFKVDVASREVSKKLPDVDVETRRARVTSESELKTLELGAADFAISCIDQPYRLIESVVGRYFENSRTPYITLASGLTGGYWGPIVKHGMTLTYSEIIRSHNSHPTDAEAAARDSFKEPGKWSFAPVNFVIASSAAVDVTLFMSGHPDVISLGRRIDYDAFRHKGLGSWLGE
jgi:ThiF family